MADGHVTRSADDALQAKVGVESAAATGPADPDAAHAARVAALRTQTVGEGAVVRGGLGLARQMLYTDYTASGRALAGIEDYMRQRVLAVYGNTHTLASSTARQTTFYRNEARQIIKSFYNCSHGDAVVFAGSGATAATQLLCALAKATRGFTGAPSRREETRWGSVRCTLCDVTLKNDEFYRAHLATAKHQAAAAADTAAAAARDAAWRGCWFLVDPTAHHSLCLPFRELAAERPTFYTVKELALDATRGCVSLDDVIVQLRAAQRLKMRCVLLLTAASNVTGIAPPRAALIRAAREHNAVVGWDLAAVAGHERFDFAPHDFAFASPHKMLGGPGTPGVLLIKKRLLTNAAPCFPGGGVVHYVSSTNHLYIEGLEEREEAGTPLILGCIRAGLVYRTHALLHMPAVAAHERALFARLYTALARHPAVEVLGSAFAPPCDGVADGMDVVPRLPIVSFNIVYNPDAVATTSGADVDGRSAAVTPQEPPSLYLHHNFVTVLLNDLFGVQVRGGCACAGPYAQRLLHMSPAWVDAYEHVLTATGLDVLRPGFVRTGVHFTMNDADVDILIAAVTWVASHGWKLLGAYDFEASTGEWSYRRENYAAERQWLSEFDVLARPPAAAPADAPAPPPSTPAALTAAANAFTDTLYTSATGVTLNTIHDPDTELTPALAPFVFFARPKDFLESVRVGGAAAAGGSSVRTFAGLVPRVAAGARGAGFGAIAGAAGPPPPASYASARRSRGGDASGTVATPGAAAAAAEWGAAVPVYGAEGHGAAAAAAAAARTGHRRPSPPAKRDLDAMRGGAGGGGADTPATPPADTAAASPAGAHEPQQKKPKKQKPGKKGTGPLMAVPKSLRATVGGAVHEYGMIKEGDKILVGLSGGKDSLCLLHVLLTIQRVSPVKFEVGAATVDPMTPEYDPSPLTAYMATLGVPYTILRHPIVELAKTKLVGERRPSICSFCSRMKRGLLYGHMRAEGYTTLALGQHLDDLAESFVMSLFRNGSLGTMKACYTIDAADTDDGGTDLAAFGAAGPHNNHGLKVIRPFAHVRERVLARLAQDHALPVIADNCPACFAVPKERHNTKVLLSQLESEQPTLFPSILKAIKPLIAVSTTDRKAKPAPAGAAAVVSAANADRAAEEATLACNIGGSCRL